jgi:hypothetical protein
MTGLLLYAEARQTKLIHEGTQRCSEVRYLSAGLAYMYLRKLAVALRTRPGYRVQFNKPYEE